MARYSRTARSSRKARCGVSIVPRLSLVMTPTWRPWLWTWALIDAARLIAYSRVDSSPLPWWTERCRSSTIRRSEVSGCSKVFDIIWPYLAESFQWIRPSESPSA